ncbi:MAG TPA: hypothetical protein VIG29_16475 [Vicinamibacteria bacterium]|jgi:hypothetical protein
MKRWVLVGLALLAVAAPALAVSRGALSSGDAAGIGALLGFLALIGGMLVHWSADPSAKSANPDNR